MPQRIKFAIIGCGKIAQRHAAIIHQLGKLEAVADIIPQKAEALAQQYQAKAFYSFAHLLEALTDDTVLVICTPNGYHATQAEQALKKGMHVICEKPLCINSQEGLSLIALAEKQQRLLIVVKQNRFNPPVQWVKQLLDQQQLGTVFAVQINGFWNRTADYYKDDWHGTHQLDGGTLFTQFSHFLDVVCWFLGKPDVLSAVTGNFTHNQLIEFEDTGMVQLQFPNGALGSLQYTVSAYEQNMEGSITLFGTMGTVKIGGAYLNNISYAAIEGLAIPPLPEGNEANAYPGGVQGSMNNHRLVYENAIAVLRGEAKPVTTAKEALETVQLIEAIYEAAARSVATA
ncbi:MAG: Gfo/Idh/MocA family protein [Chitinophagaceae bacterium]